MQDIQQHYSHSIAYITTERRMLSSQELWASTMYLLGVHKHEWQNMQFIASLHKIHRRLLETNQYD